MKFIKATFPFSLFAIGFLLLGIIMSDPRQFSFGIVWLLIASAKFVLMGPKKERVN